VALRLLHAPLLKYDGWFPHSTAEAWFDADSAPVSVDIASFSSYPAGASAATPTWSHTSPAGATLLVVEIATGPNGANTTSGVTFNGVALTKWDTTTSSANTSNRRAEVWYLVNPPAVTANVVITNTAALPTGATATSLYNADTTTPLATAIKNSATTGTSDSLTPSATAGAIFLAIESARSTTGVTRGTAQVGLANYIAGTSSNLSYDASWRYTYSPASSWSWAASDEHAAIGVAVCFNNCFR
jgi:hypothetical protein